MKPIFGTLQIQLIYIVMLKTQTIFNTLCFKVNFCMLYNEQTKPKNACWGLLAASSEGESLRKHLLKMKDC